MSFKLFCFKVGLSTPKPNPDETPSASFGHMLSMLFQWFNATAYLPSDKTGDILSNWKEQIQCFTVKLNLSRPGPASSVGKGAACGSSDPSSIQHSGNVFCARGNKCATSIFSKNIETDAEKTGFLIGFSLSWLRERDTLPD